MDSLQEILSKKDFTPPDEVSLIKDYVLRKYDSPCSVKVDKTTVVISVPSSSLASVLQFERSKIRDKFRINKKLVVRIGR